MLISHLAATAFDKGIKPFTKIIILIPKHVVKELYFFFQINLDDLNNRLNDLEKITVSIIVIFCCVQVFTTILSR